VGEGVGDGGCVKGVGEGVGDGGVEDAIAETEGTVTKVDAPVEVAVAEARAPASGVQSTVPMHVFAEPPADPVMELKRQSAPGERFILLLAVNPCRQPSR
jgi:hypothetical protein